VTAKNPLQELLNKLIWDSRLDKSEYTIVYKDSQQPGGEKEIPFSHIYKVDKFGIDILGGDYIPLHKIISIKKQGLSACSK